MEIFWQDTRYAIRRLLREPGFTAVAVFTLALGIGATSAMFSVVNSVVLQPLPYPDPDRLVMVFQNRPQGAGALRGRISGILGNDLDPWREQKETFSRLATYGPQSATLTGRGEPIRLEGAEASPDLFPLLGVGPLMGRLFAPEEELRGSQKVVLLSYSPWQKHFGSDPAILDKMIELESENWLVVGVMGADFAFPDATTAYWVPSVLSSRGAPVRDINILPAVARIKPESSLQEATAESNTIFQRLRQDQRQAASGARNEAGRLRAIDRLAEARIELLTLQELIIGPVRSALLIMLAAVGLVLLIACANVANLLLSRSTEREKEITLRSALGARRTRLVRQLLTENVALALPGGALGVFLAWLGVSLLRALQPGNIPRLEVISIDFSVLFFATVISLATALLFGSVPALKLLRTDRRKMSGGEEGNAGRPDYFSNNRLLSVLAVGEIGLALVLLVGAGLLTSSFLRLSSRDPGYNPDNVLTFRVTLSENRYQENPQRQLFYDQLFEQIDRLRPVRSADIVNFLPMQSGGIPRILNIVGRPRPDDLSQAPFAGIRLLSPGYFQTMGIPVRSGRAFSEEDRAGQPLVLVVNEALVSRYFEGEEPVGQRIRFGQQEYEVAGVVGNVRHQGLDSEPEPEFYLSFKQAPAGLLRMLSNMNIVIRMDRDPLDLVPQIRSEIASLDPEIALEEVSTLDQRLYDSVAGPRFYMVMVGLFATIAVTLAAIGIWGVMANRVSLRTREIGVRMALGAEGGAVLGMVMRQGLLVVAAGLGCGLLGAFALSRYLESMLFGTTPLDTATFMIVVLLLAAVALIACYVPARRATLVDPSVALRHE